MNQFWQSLALTVVVGGTLAAGVAYGITRFGTEPPVETSSTATTTANPAAAALPAAVATAPKDPFMGMNLSGQAAIVLDLSNGRTLYSQNADVPLPLASLTKLLTLYEAGRVLTPQSLVTISSTSLAQDGNYGLAFGETFAYQDLARFALVASSNDAAQAIAEAAASVRGQTVPQFMASAVASAGLSHTRAVSSTGLDIDLTTASNFGSARDMAKLAGEFLEAAPDVSEATTHTAVTAYSTTGVPHSLPNTNQDVTAMPGILLSKTGFTDIAGGNLVVVFDAGIHHPIAVVVLGSTHEARFTDVEKLMTATLASFQSSPNS